MLVSGKPYRSVWLEGSLVKAIDQRRLPLAGQARYLLIAGHGFLTLGATLDGAGQLALVMHQKSLTACRSS